MRESIAEDGPLAVNEPVIMEVLAGARDENREAALRCLLLRFELLRFDVVADFDRATRMCRAAGVTPRGMEETNSHRMGKVAHLLGFEPPTPSSEEWLKVFRRVRRRWGDFQRGRSDKGMGLVRLGFPLIP